MAKSNRRRRKDRAKASTRRAETRKRRARTAEIRAVQQRVARIHDPAFGKLAEEVAWLTVDPAQDEDDLASGTDRYVEFPPEATAGLARWTVWLGGIVPVDGVWHSTGLGVRLSPAEGDAAWLREQLDMPDELAG